MTQESNLLTRTEQAKTTSDFVHQNPSSNMASGNSHLHHNRLNTSSSQGRLARKLSKLVETTYRNNLESDYTEKIVSLTRDFKYDQNQSFLWSDPSHSLLYGTPLYEEASSAQRLALNHLGWFANYNYISNSETETVIYNQVTGSVFRSIGGYDTLADELMFETCQEHDHIKAFRKVGLMTATSLIGRRGLNELLKWNSYKLTLGKQSLPTYQYYALRSLATLVGSREHRAHYSSYLQTLEKENGFILKAPTAGMLGRSIGSSLPWQSFYSFSWGMGSPFMACHFYTVRMIANLYLKNMEHAIAKYARQLENSGEIVPAPTAISRYHFLDEAFHTTISKLLAKDLYREFSPPTTFEKLAANSVLYSMQTGTLGGLSAVLPHRYFSDDLTILELIYQLFQSPVFGFSRSDTKYWMEKCFCQEHEGIHKAAANRARLLKELKDFFADIDYLWPVNRHMNAMASQGNISSALVRNRRTFKTFFQQTQADS